MTTYSGYCNSCPEAPSTINITQTTITIDGVDSMFNDEVFLIGGSSPNHAISVDSTGAYTRLVLTNQPYARESLEVHKNGVLQRYGTDYWLSGQTVILTTAAVASDTFAANYVSLSAVAASSEDQSPVGTLKPFDWGSSVLNVPYGWLACDGTTSLAKATYPSLWTFVNSEGYALSSTTTHFVLKNLSVVVYDGTIEVQVPAIIKY